MPDLHRPDRVGVQDRPRPPITPPGPARPPRGRSRTPPRGREGILAPGGRAASTRAPGTSGKTWRLPGSRQEGPGVARTRRGCGACGRRSPAGAGPGGTVRTTGPAKGNPVPARPAAPRLPPPPAQTGAGWSTSPACRPGRGSAAPPSSRGLFSRRIVGWATSSRTGHRQRGRRPRAGDPAAQAPRRRRPRGPGTTTVASACPSPTPDDSSTRAPVASAGAVGSSYAGAAAEALGKSYKRGARSGATAPGRTATTPGTATAQWVNRCQPHPTPPRQPRRPLTRRRRTPLPSQPHHHHRRGIRHGITNPPQNPGRSSSRRSCCCRGGGRRGRSRRWG